MSREDPKLRRIRSQVFSTSQRNCSFAALQSSLTAYALGVFKSLKPFPSEDPCPSRGRDALAVPPSSTAARTHSEHLRETFKDFQSEQCSVAATSPDRQTYPRLTLDRPPALKGHPSQAFSRPFRINSRCRPQNQTADFDVFLPSKIRYLPENRKAATSMTFHSLKHIPTGLRTSTTQVSWNQHSRSHNVSRNRHRKISCHPQPHQTPAPDARTQKSEDKQGTLNSLDP
jgi:hypothetical protein